MNLPQSLWTLHKVAPSLCMAFKGVLPSDLWYKGMIPMMVMDRLKLDIDSAEINALG